jgi:hypothetical protein
LINSKFCGKEALFNLEKRIGVPMGHNSYDCKCEYCNLKNANKIRKDIARVKAKQKKTTSVW